MTPFIRLLLTVQVAVFAFAALAHFGVIGDRDDPAAGTAESIIALVLLGGLVLGASGIYPTRATAFAAQGFALLGTLVGFTLVMTVGPRTTFDVGMHALMLLIGGLVLTRGAGSGESAVARRSQG
jgi:peptidoglycan/LPS O-acetylase OafA/YrhL